MEAPLGRGFCKLTTSESQTAVGTQVKLIYNDMGSSYFLTCVKFSNFDEFAETFSIFFF